MGLGRTRPKKLTPKAAIPIIGESDIDIIDDEVQSTLQQVETGVEKAEESVRCCPFPPGLILAGILLHIIIISRDIITNVRPL